MNRIAAIATDKIARGRSKNRIFEESPVFGESICPSSGESGVSVIISLSFVLVNSATAVPSAGTVPVSPTAFRVYPSTACSVT